MIDPAEVEAVKLVSLYARLAGEAIGILEGWTRYVDGPRGDLTKDHIMRLTKEFLGRAREMENIHAERCKGTGGTGRE